MSTCKLCDQPNNLPARACWLCGDSVCGQCSSFSAEANFNFGMLFTCRQCYLQERGYRIVKIPS